MSKKSAHKASGGLIGMLREKFSVFAQATARMTGHPATFLLAVAVVIVWGVTGPLFGYSDTWQLVINTGTTIITFLMVFLIQNTQNRDTLSLQLKLSELVLAMKGAEDKFADIEDMTDDELEHMHQQICKQAQTVATIKDSRQALSRTAAHRAKSSTRKSSARKPKSKSK
jgi:low affinity Fe/Cu permease